MSSFGVKFSFVCLFLDQNRNNEFAAFSKFRKLNSMRDFTEYNLGLKCPELLLEERKCSC